MLYSNIFFLFFIVSEYRLYLIQRTSFQHEIHHFLGRLPVISQPVVCEINKSSLIKPLRAYQPDSVKGQGLRFRHNGYSQPLLHQALWRPHCKQTATVASQLISGLLNIWWLLSGISVIRVVPDKSAWTGSAWEYGGGFDDFQECPAGDGIQHSCRAVRFGRTAGTGTWRLAGCQRLGVSGRLFC